MPKQVKSSLYRGATLLFGTLVFVVALYLAAGREPTWIDRGFILALMLCTTGALLFLLGRIAIALTLCGVIFAGLRFISTTKLRYLDSPLMPADFLYFANTSLVETLRHYPNFKHLAVAILLLAPILLIAIWFGDRHLLPGARGWRLALIRVVGTAICLFGLWVCLLPNGPFSVIINKPTWYKLSDGARLTNFFATIHDYEIRLPGSTQATASGQWVETRPLPAARGKPYPDIIQVLEESTFDPSSFAGCNIPQCGASLFKPDANTRGHGLLRTHTAGGGTWVSEFSSLTGMPQDIFGPAGMYAPYVLAPRVTYSLPRFLDKLGYETIAIYPTDGNFVNGRNAYKAYGFDKFYDVKDLHLTMWHATDAQIFTAARKVYEENKKPGQPVFMMILTLEQHGPHDNVPISKLPPPYNQGLIHGLTTKQALNLSNYIARLHDSDTGMKQLEHNFLDRDNPTLIVQFGDHQPSFSGLIRSIPRGLPAAALPYREYLTYYMIKTNFMGPELPQYPVLDIAYLPSMVLNAAGLPQNVYFASLEALRARCDGLYEDCQDKSVLHSYYAWTFGHLKEIR